MNSRNAERLAKYRAKMEQAGFRRLSFYVCPELNKMLLDERRPSECGGRTLERLLLGEAAKRPDYWTQEELMLRRAKAEAARTRMRGIILSNK